AAPQPNQVCGLAELSGASTLSAALSRHTGLRRAGGRAGSRRRPPDSAWSDVIPGRHRGGRFTGDLMVVRQLPHETPTELACRADTGVVGSRQRWGADDGTVTSLPPDHGDLLAVDDEPFPRDAVAASLRFLGFDVAT